MECFKTYKPSLHEMLLNAEKYIVSNQLEQIYTEEAWNGERVTYVSKDSKRYRLTSSYSPKHEAEKWVEQYKFLNNNTIITIFGFGTGSFVREIVNNRGENDILFIYEPSLQLFIHVMEQYDITDIICAINVVFAFEEMNDFEFHNLLQNVTNITNLYTQINSAHPYYETIFPESGVKYWKELKDNKIHTQININTEKFFGKRVIFNSLYNIKFLKDSIRLEDMKPLINVNIPAIIVAAGPSLKECINDLKSVMGKAYIFAVDTIVDFIMKEGITPDYIVTIDPAKNIKYFGDQELDMPLLCEMASNKHILRLHKGKKIFYSCLPYFENLYTEAGKEPPTLYTGASVSTAAFSVGIQLGFKRIILVGQDLAYEGESSHFYGTTSNEFIDTQDIMVDGINGDQIRSRMDWYEFIMWFQDMITIHPDVEVIDAKNNGAKIKGTKVMPFEEAIKKYCTTTYDLKDAELNNYILFSDEDMKRVRLFLDNSSEDLFLIKKKANEGIELCETQIRLYQRYHTDTSETIKNYEKLSKINILIGGLPVYSLLETFITASSASQLSEIYTFTDDEEHNKIATYQRTKSVLAAIVEGVDYVKPLFQDTITVLQQ